MVEHAPEHVDDEVEVVEEVVLEDGVVVLPQYDACVVQVTQAVVSLRGYLLTLE